MIRIAFVVALVLASSTWAQDDGEPTFEEEDINVADVLLQPFVKHKCTNSTWEYDVDTPDSWGAAGEIDVMSHVGQHWGCSQLNNEFGIAAEAHTTHLVAYGGTMTPVSMFVFSVLAKGDANNALLSADYEKLNLSVGTGFVGGVIESIYEVDSSGSMVAELELNTPKYGLTLQWDHDEHKINPKEPTLRGVTFTARANATYFTDELSDFVKTLAGIDEDIELEFTFYTSTDYGVLSLAEEVPLSALGCEFIVKVKGWKYKTEGNRIGIKLNTFQKSAEIIREAGVHKIVRHGANGDFYDGSYWNFPSLYQTCSSKRKRECSTGTLDIEMTDTSAEEVSTGNIVMDLKLKALLGSQRTTTQILLTSTAANAEEVIFDPGFGVGEYPDAYIKDPSCTDNVQNGEEDGVDCGGTECDACPESCHGDVVFIGCPSCHNRLVDGDETDIDCGGSCGACGNCMDEIQNQNEEGIDCGGICALPPNVGTGTKCPEGTTEPSCTDNIKNGDETGVDCGGSICKLCDTNSQVDNNAASLGAVAALSTVVLIAALF